MTDNNPAAVYDEAMLRLLFKLVAGENQDFICCLPDLDAEWVFYERALFTTLFEGRLLVMFHAICQDGRYYIWLRGYLRERADDSVLGPGCVLIRADYGFVYDSCRKTART